MSNDPAGLGTDEAAGLPDLPSRRPIGQIIEGDAAEVMRCWDADWVDMVVTSPPYFGQRDYGHPEQLGQETDPRDYVARLVALFEEAKRVLKSRGTCWVVLGDKYDRGRLLGMPWRFAIAMQDAGWLLRSDIIWHKPNAMPSATKNRPTTDHEYIFLFAKSTTYDYYADAIREPHVTFTDKSRMKGGRRHLGVRGGTPEAGKNGGSTNLHDGRWDQAFHPKGRNKRTVWSIPLSKSRAAHFAVFPRQLAETCIAAGSIPGEVVLDPFCGSGTSLQVAKSLQRRFVGIDCNPEYVQLARSTVDQVDVAQTTRNKSKSCQRGAK